MENQVVIGGEFHREEGNEEMDFREGEGAVYL